MPGTKLSRKAAALRAKSQRNGHRECNGTTKSGQPCQNLCGVDKDYYDEFWPGVTDRCRYHIDEVARRTRDLARIAGRSGADPVESLQPPERKKQIRGAGKAGRRPVKRSGSTSVEPASRRANGTTGRLRQLTFGFAAAPAALQPPGFGPGPRSLTAQLDEPPRLERGPRPTVSNAVEARGENN
jgi:hypothetical protein